jgi:hypothetical protein
MTTLVTRAGKGSALTHNEMDTNIQIAVPDTMAKTATYAVQVADEGNLLLVAPASNTTITLPAAGTAGDGFQIGVKRTNDAGTYTLTVDGSGSETIDGETSLTLEQNGALVWLVCDGSNWFITSAFKTGGSQNPITPQAGGQNYRWTSGLYEVNASLDSGAYQYSYYILGDKPNAQVTVSSTASGLDGSFWPYTDGKTDANGNFFFGQGGASLCGTEAVDGTWTLTVTVSGGIGGPDNDGVYEFSMKRNN